MTAREGLRLLPALLLHRSGCQQVPITGFVVCCGVQTRLCDALSSVAHAPGTAWRGLTTLSGASGCKAAPGCGCSACSAGRLPRDEASSASADQYGRPLQPGGGTPAKRGRAPDGITGAGWQHSWHVGGSAAQRSYSTAASVPLWQRRQRRSSWSVLSPAVTGSWHSASGRRTYSTLEEHQSEVRDSKARQSKKSAFARTCDTSAVSHMAGPWNQAPFRLHSLAFG